jgi:sigma-B regulation protein RsbU (phosphoserine phosphatase)
MRLTMALLLLAAARLSAQSALQIDLSGEWSMSDGDLSQYAQPDFDDSGWTKVRLPWTISLRYGTYVYWLRRTMDLPEWADRNRLAITLGPVREMYKLFINGVMIGQTGPLDGEESQIAHDRTFAIPRQALGDGPRIVIAVRTMEPNIRTSTWRIYSGGKYMITYASNAPVGAAEDTINRQKAQYAPQLVLASLLLFIGLQLFLFWIAEKNRLEIFWLGTMVASRGARDAVVFSFLSADSYPWRRFNAPDTLNCLAAAATAELVMAAVGVRNNWLRALVWLVAFLPIAVPAFISREYVLFRSSIILAILLFGWWRGGGLKHSLDRHLIAVVLCLLVSTQINSNSGRLYPVFFPMAGYLWSTQSTSIMVLATILTFLLLRNLIADRREKQRMAGELEAARGVQQLLFSGALPASSDYRIDAVYEPALELGGDFYQVLPAGDEAILVVIGDVSGKGLKAALVVSLMTGAARAHAALQPAALLKEMNRVAGVGSGGFVTCMAIRCERGGELTIANAGHLMPYRDGVELSVEPGLPLGVTLDAEYVDVELNLASGEAITFVTDGIVEAADTKGHLFGFERTREISVKPASVIAEAAKAWGQNDDITVVTVRRNA